MTVLLDIYNDLGHNEAIQFGVDQLNMTPEYAEFVLAMELGQIDGDLIIEEE